MTRYVLDAWAILAFLQQEEPAATRMRSLLRQAKAPSEIELYASVLNLGEVYYRVAKRKSETQASQALAFLRRVSIQPVSATDERVYAAAHLKSRFSISYADAFACATSHEFGAILVTGDPEMIRLSDLLHIEILTQNELGR